MINFWFFLMFYCIYSITHYVAFVEDVPTATWWDKFWAFPTTISIELYGISIGLYGKIFKS
jgi:hypothetical protein